MSSSPIGIFDSGVGGLSILLELQKLLPHETFIFLADQAFVPYGGKSKEELVERTRKIMDFFMIQNVKLVVMACNTATVYTIDEMRKKYEVPIVGTVPVVRTIARLTKSKKAVVFSTPGTAKSEYLEHLIDKFGNGTEIKRVGGSNLEELVEEGNLDRPEITNVLKDILTPLVKSGVDAIALGCTHYPFLSDKIEEIVGPNVVVVDSGGAVARHTKQVLENNKALSKSKSQDKYFTTGNPAKFRSVAEELTGSEIGFVEKVTI